MYDLKGKTVLITGASAGIGAACVSLFAQAGARVLCCARRLDKTQRIAQEAQTAFGGEAHAFVMDVSNAESVTRALAQLPSDWRNIDILVNNAGMGKGLDPVYENSVDHIDAMIDTNVKGLLYVTRAVVPGMVARNSGHIINIGSIAGRTVYPGGTVYCATKHAVFAINKGLKRDLHGTAVRVSTVDPGMVETEFSLVRFSGDAERAKATYQGFTPLTATDIADAVLFCATRPPHVNINELVLMPTDQSAAHMVNRRKKA